MRWEVFFAPFYPVLSPQMLIPRWVNDRMCFPFSYANVHYFFLGRSAIYALARFWNLAGNQVLFPAYFEGIELEALLAAGVRLRFYPVRDRMHVEVEDVVARIGPETRAVFLTHYLGFPAPVLELSEICRKRGVLLIEDCAHALLSCLGKRPLGSFGDAAIFSLHKTLPLAGGALVVRGGAALPKRNSPSLVSTLGEAVLGLDRYFQLHGMTYSHLLTMRIGYMSKTASRGLGGGWVPIETSHFNTSHTVLGMSRLSRMLLHAQDFAAIVERRRRNFTHLLDRLRDLAPPLFDTLPSGVCPLAYPMEVDNKEALIMRLQANGVNAVNFWSRHHPSGPKEPSPEVVRLRRSVLALPCTQDLSPKVIERVAQQVRTTMRQVS